MHVCQRSVLVSSSTFLYTSKTRLKSKNTVFTFSPKIIFSFSKINSPSRLCTISIVELSSISLTVTTFSRRGNFIFPLIRPSLPVVSYDKLTLEEKARFDNVNIGKGVLAQDELLSQRLPEMPANIIPIIEQIWLEEVVGK